MGNRHARPRNTNPQHAPLHDRDLRHEKANRLTTPNQSHGSPAPSALHAAIRSGACGFILKHWGPALLVETVRAAVAGDALISPQVTVRLLKQLAGPETPRSPGERLSDRESQVARLIADGRINAEISKEMFISANTVKTHIARIQRKLGVRNRVGIAQWAWNTDHPWS